MQILLIANKLGDENSVKLRLVERDSYFNWQHRRRMKNLTEFQFIFKNAVAPEYATYCLVKLWMG
jgi:hypothetical protein